MDKNKDSKRKSEKNDGIVEKLKKSKVRNRVIGLGVVCLLGGVSVIYFNKAYIYNDEIAKNIFIEDVEVSKMSKEEAIEAINKKYTPENLSLKYEDKNYTISPSDIDLKYNVEEVVDNAYDYTKKESYFDNLKNFIGLRNNAQEFEIKSSYDEAKLSDAIQNISKVIDVPVESAKVYISDSGNISVSGSTTGKQFDVGANKEVIYDRLQNKNYEPIELKVDVKEPNVTTEQAKSVNSLLAEYSTKYNMNHLGRTHNIILSAKKASDVLLMPGEVYSYNNLTGMRTRSNGYKDAPVIIKGKLEDALGGGVCQTSSTMFNTVLTSGMEITIRRNHSIASDYVPMGQDAMVNDGGQDFKFRNPYNHPVYIKNTINNGVLVSRIYGNSGDKKNIRVKVDKFKQNGLDATNTYRQYLDASGKVLKTEYIGKSVYKKLEK